MSAVGSHLGSRRHLRVCRETTWGVCPGSPTWHDVPILDDGMKLKATDPRYVPDTNVPGWKRRYHISHFQVVAGGIVTHPWPELTDFLVNMALERVTSPADADYQDLYSYCLDHFTPEDPRRYLGAVCERLSIAATGGGDSGVRLALAMRAKKEEENDSLQEHDFDYSGVSKVPFMFAHAALQLTPPGGAPAAVADVGAFSITVENNVQAGPNCLGYVAYLVAAQRKVSLELIELNNDDAFNEAIRDGGSFAFQATFTHPAGYTWALSLPVLYVTESDEDGTPDAPAKEAPRLEAGTDESGDDITSSVNLGTTTTTAGP